PAAPAALALSRVATSFGSSTDGPPGRLSFGMNLWQRIKERLAGKAEPEHLRRGRLGEAAAKRHLQTLGLKFLTANFRSARGEIDLVFRDADCLVFVEVKTRTAGGWVRPAGSVNARKRRLL